MATSASEGSVPVPGTQAGDTGTHKMPTVSRPPPAKVDLNVADPKLGNFIKNWFKQKRIEQATLEQVLSCVNADEEAQSHLTGQNGARIDAQQLRLFFRRPAQESRFVVNDKGPTTTIKCIGVTDTGVTKRSGSPEDVLPTVAKFPKLSSPTEGDLAESARSAPDSPPIATTYYSEQPLSRDLPLSTMADGSLSSTSSMVRTSVAKSLGVDTSEFEKHLQFFLQGEPVKTELLRLDGSDNSFRGLMTPVNPSSNPLLTLFEQMQQQIVRVEGQVTSLKGQVTSLNQRVFDYEDRFRNIDLTIMIDQLLEYVGFSQWKAANGYQAHSEGYFFSLASKLKKMGMNVTALPDPSVSPLVPELAQYVAFEKFLRDNLPNVPLSELQHFNELVRLPRNKKMHHDEAKSSRCLTALNGLTSDYDKLIGQKLFDKLFEKELRRTPHASSQPQPTAFYSATTSHTSAQSQKHPRQLMSPPTTSQGRQSTNLLAPLSMSSTTLPFCSPARSLLGTGPSTSGQQHGGGWNAARRQLTGPTHMPRPQHHIRSPVRLSHMPTGAGSGSVASSPLAAQFSAGVPPSGGPHMNPMMQAANLSYCLSQASFIGGGGGGGSGPGGMQGIFSGGSQNSFAVSPGVHEASATAQLHLLQAHSTSRQTIISSVQSLGLSASSVSTGDTTSFPSVSVSISSAALAQNVPSASAAQITLVSYDSSDEDDSR